MKYIQCNDCQKSKKVYSPKDTQKLNFCNYDCYRSYFKKYKKSRQEILKSWNKKAKEYKRRWHEKKYFNHSGILNKLSTCEICYTKNDLVIHHKDGQNGRLGKKLNNKKINLQILCRSCHPKIHTRLGVKERVGGYYVK